MRNISSHLYASDGEEFSFGPLKTGTKTAMLTVSFLAWAGVIVTNIGNIFDLYPRVSGQWKGLYGHSARGMAGAGQRFIEGMSYFTMVSNVLVAVVFLMLALSARKTKRRVVLVDSAVLMITITSLIFLTAILPYIQLSGLSLVTSPWQHVVVPFSAWIVWLLWGPRDFYVGSRLMTVAHTLVLPALWIVWMLIYGAFTGYYPYGFVNVNELGYAGVALSLLVVTALGIVIEIALGYVDRILLRKK
ncbi:Pr6Pr family membrane protein [Alloscardovia criceti]|uniref:Pr6Pr family membrane protein n=1 Tax=Alloscardovia criceti TaxID=356828 RepID=UPI00036C87BA|nr:Pr6Pr family membrane protein [Alloscardovia criceti]